MAVVNNLVGNFGFGKLKDKHGTAENQWQKTKSQRLPRLESDQGQSKGHQRGGLELQTQEEGYHYFLDETATWKNDWENYLTFLFTGTTGLFQFLRLYVPWPLEVSERGMLRLLGTESMSDLGTILDPTIASGNLASRRWLDRYVSSFSSIKDRRSSFLAGSTPLYWEKSSSGTKSSSISLERTTVRSWVIGTLSCFMTSLR